MGAINFFESGKRVTSTEENTFIKSKHKFIYKFMFAYSYITIQISWVELHTYLIITYLHTHTSLLAFVYGEKD